MTRVLVDVNGLLMPFQFNINLDAELRRLLGDCEVLVTRQVLGELKNLSKRVPEAKAALAMAERYRVVGSGPGPTDEGIATLARREGAYVLTNDRGLIERLKAERVRVVRLRGRSHLAVEGDYS